MGQDAQPIAPAPPVAPVADAPPRYTATTNRAWLPRRGHFAHFHRRARLPVSPGRSFRMVVPPFAVGAAPPAWPTPQLPVDWTKGHTLSFPIDGNDYYGDCGIAMAAHADNTFTGMNGQESSFDVNTLIRQYLSVSQGDNGLSEPAVVEGIWKPGIAGNSQAVIYDALDLDPTDATAMQAAIYLFGGVCFSLDVPDAWLHGFDTGAVWDAPAVADPEHGHFVWFNGVDVRGNYNVTTWGSYCWLTPAGLRECVPAAFVVFSPRWFNAQGVAPNGKGYAELASLWQQAGGNALPPSPFGPTPGPTPTPTPIPPTPIPTPTPTPIPIPPTPTPMPVPSGTAQVVVSFYSDASGGWQVIVGNSPPPVAPPAPGPDPDPSPPDPPPDPSPDSSPVEPSDSSPADVPNPIDERPTAGVMRDLGIAINAERKRLGLAELEWDENLALSCVNVANSWSSGKMALTQHTIIASGFKSLSAVMGAWSVRNYDWGVITGSWSRMGGAVAYSPEGKPWWVVAFA